MEFLLTHILPIAACFAYLGASVYYSRVFSASSFYAVSARGYLLLLFGFVCHVGFLFGELMFYRIEQMPQAFALSFVSCIFTGLFLIIARNEKLKTLGAFVAPLTTLCVVISSFLFHFSEAPPAAEAEGALLKIHIAAAVIAYVVLLLAFSASSALIFQEYLLRRRKLTGAFLILPSIESLDKLNMKLIVVGFASMIVALLSAVYMLGGGSLVSILTDPRMVWALFTLVVYAVLLGARSVYGLRGRRAALLSIVGFLLLVGSFTGVHLFESVTATVAREVKRDIYNPRQVSLQAELLRRRFG